MNTDSMIAALDDNVSVFDGLLRHISPEQQYFRPHPQHWCLLEITSHLHDEEVDDFGARMRSVIDDPCAQLPKTDPQAWPAQRHYLEQDYHKALDRFLNARRHSVRWMRSFDDEQWDRAHIHPEKGPLTARFFLANWLAHDYLHLRQIVKVRYHALIDSVPVRFDYAGEW